MFGFQHVTEQLLSFQAAPWQLAPKPLIAAHVAVDKANDLLVEAIGAVEDAEIDLPNSVAQYDQAAKAAVRSGKPLPDKTKLELAGYKASLAKEDLATAKQAIRATSDNVAALLEGGSKYEPEGDPELRQAWLASIDTRTDTLREQIRAAADAIAPAVAELNALLGVGQFVAQWRVLAYVPAGIEGDPVGALHAAANTRGHADREGHITAA